VPLVVGFIRIRRPPDCYRRISGLFSFQRKTNHQNGDCAFRPGSIIASVMLLV
jgi:hypothetical protein